MHHLITILTAHRDLSAAAEFADQATIAARKRLDLVDRAVQLGIATQTEGQQAAAAYAASCEAYAKATGATARTGKAVREAIEVLLREGLEQNGAASLIPVLREVLTG